VVDSLKLKISAAQIASEVSVAVVPNAVILTVTVTVTDPSPERARDIVNALSVEFTELAAEPETPQGGIAAATKVTVVQKASLARATVHPERTPTEHGSTAAPGSGDDVRRAVVGVIDDSTVHEEPSDDRADGGRDRRADDELDHDPRAWAVDEKRFEPGVDSRRIQAAASAGSVRSALVTSAASRCGTTTRETRGCAVGRWNS